MKGIAPLFADIGRRCALSRGHRFKVAAACLVVTTAFWLTLSARAQETGQQYSPPGKANQGEPIVGGHKLQPREGELGKSDVTNKDAKTVDDLYKKLIEEERQRGNLSPSSGAGAGKPPAAKNPPQ